MKQALIALFLVIGAVGGVQWPCRAVEEPKTPYWKAVVIHISDSDHMTHAECDKWHRARGWDSCGYSFVVQPDGSIYEARGYSKVGAHTLGHNKDMLGFCFVTKDCANKIQVQAFLTWLAQTEALYGAMKVYPHRAFANKTCPNAVWHQLLQVFTASRPFGSRQYEVEEQAITPTSALSSTK